MTIKDVAQDLRNHLGRPDWLVSIGVVHGVDTIVLYTKSKKIPKEARKLIDEGWKGHIVIARVLGGIILL